MTLDDQKARALANSDQAWAHWDDMLDEIAKVADNHPLDTREDRIIAGCLMLVAGELHMRRAERGET